MRGTDSTARPVTPGSRLRAMPHVAALLAGQTPEAALANLWVRFVKSLIGEDGLRMEDTIAPDVRCIELELLGGLPPGRAGFKLFREQMNAAFPDERVIIREMRVFAHDNIVETELLCGGTHSGTLMGIPPTGRSVEFVILTLNRFENGLMHLRWDRSPDLGAVIGELAAAGRA